MSEPAPRVVYVDQVLATARRIVLSDREACRFAIDERRALAAYAIVADHIIRNAGLAYPNAGDPTAEIRA